MNYFSLFSSCVLTKGIIKNCLIDLERSIYCSIQKELYDILFLKYNIDILKIKQDYHDDDFIIIKKYLDFLAKERFIYFHEKEQKNKICFNKDNFDNPYNLEDILIDLNSFKSFNLILNKIPKNIEILQLRFFFKVSIRELRTMVKQLIYRGTVKIELMLQHNENNNEVDYKNLFYEFKVISKIHILSFHKNKHIIPHSVIGIKQSLTSHKQCGVISESLFSPNLRTILNSKNYNSCLNKKISIDINGNIKNCPSMPQSFGNIKDTSLEKALNHPDFKKYWNITKDQINVCRDCEFRYICTDCRGYTEDPNDIYSKPLKCGYSPYTNEWEEWSTNPLKQKAIEYYGMQELVKKND